jgi:hypothetical protein
MLKMPPDHEDETVSTSQATRTSDTIPSSADVESVRAELQVQLVVLAAQLSEIGSTSDAEAIGASSSQTVPETRVGVGPLDAVAAALTTMLSPGEINSQLPADSSVTPAHVHSNLDVTPSIVAENDRPSVVSVSASTTTPELVPMDAMDDSDDEDMDEVVV